MTLVMHLFFAASPRFVMIILLGLIGFSRCTKQRGRNFSVEEKIEMNIADDVESRHRIDTLDLLILVSLMILVIFTFWFTKKIKLKGIHETGLAMIYGLIVGAIIYATAVPSTRNRTVVDPINHTDYDKDNKYVIPAHIFLQVCALPEDPNLNISSQCSEKYQRMYQYDFNRMVPENEQRKEIGSDQEELLMKISFNPEVFLNLILPPIIFNAGYSMDSKAFFSNIGGICVLAFIGTVVATFVTAAVIYPFTFIKSAVPFTFSSCVMFGSMVSATDPISTLAIFQELGVEPSLYALVFGEALLNDAIAFVLSDAVLTYEQASIDPNIANGAAVAGSIASFFSVFFGALFIGLTCAFVCALITKYSNLNNYNLLETSMFFLFSYASFLAAETCGFSGIVSILFCGIAQAHYTYSNLSDESRKMTIELFELLNFIMENFCFVYIGITVFTFKNHHWDPYFISGSMLGIIVSRAINIYPLCAFLNCVRKHKIPWNHRNMLYFSGLRGAMAFALSIRDTASIQKQTMLSATLVIVMVTVFFCGASMMPVINFLKIKYKGGVGVQALRIIDSSHDVIATDETLAETTSENVHLPESASTHAASREPHYKSISTYPQGNFIPSPIQISRAVDSAGTITHKENWTDRIKASDPFPIRLFTKFDVYFLRPLLTHSRPALSDTCSDCCSCIRWLARILTTDQQMNDGVKAENDSMQQSLVQVGGLPRPDFKLNDSQSTMKEMPQSGMRSHVFPNDEFQLPDSAVIEPAIVEDASSSITETTRRNRATGMSSVTFDVGHNVDYTPL